MEHTWEWPWETGSRDARTDVAGNASGTRLGIGEGLSATSVVYIDIAPLEGIDSMTRKEGNCHHRFGTNDDIYVAVETTIAVKVTTYVDSYIKGDPTPRVNAREEGSGDSRGAKHSPGHDNKVLEERLEADVPALTDN